jgi:hypothetical protein
MSGSGWDEAIERVLAASDRPADLARAFAAATLLGEVGMRELLALLGLRLAGCAGMASEMVLSRSSAPTALGQLLADSFLLGLDGMRELQSLLEFRLAAYEDERKLFVGPSEDKPGEERADPAEDRELFDAGPPVKSVKKKK